MTIGEKIKAIRTKKGISQAKLAEDSGIGVASIQRIEYGLFQPKKETVHKIAKALGVHPLVLTMDEKDYLESQHWLTRKLNEKKKDPTYTGKRLEGYKEAIWEVKSKLRDIFYTMGDE